MVNIELKAKLRDRERVLAACGEIGALFQGAIRQTDTYFRVPEGRFKLRISEPGAHYLVFYRRADLAGPKACNYVIRTVEPDILEVLQEALGVLAVVEKVRGLWLWENVRIHLDRVAGLGEFLEFEAVLAEKDDPDENTRKVARLQENFGIATADLLETSYLEMILDTHGAA